ncbi:hypothetical protein [Streptomyces neyagawaensis]|uniref:hypothetical protein n=1 Tax=Streptomyces neyagawaensis TaxID=42238 RepID=UPI0006E3045C|nr:hypothetical protein [Streptomyces neyagawaensis]MCL6738372.1 hypothetical protein [Streptomyces neyagawaensis]MDE1684514.1 hypothetical protein [Streptomyces neyagawaensis]
MHKLRRHALLSALSAITVATLVATGCSNDSSSTADKARAAAVETPEAAAAEEQLAVVSAPTDGATPTAVADGNAVDQGKAKKSTLKVASYDRKTGRAVIAAPPARDTKPTADPSPSKSAATGPGAESDAGSDEESGAAADQGPDAERDSGPAKGSGSERGSASGSAPASAPADGSHPVAVGDVIASAPAPGAPDGLLAKVTDIVGTTEDGSGTTVQTEPAELNSVLGESKADGAVPVDPSTMDIDPLVQGVKVSWAKTGDLTFGPQGAKLPLGSLRIDVGAAVETAAGAPASAAASVHGFVQLAPEVAFSYDGSGAGTGAAPGGAFLGLTGDWASKWSLKGRAAGTTDGKPVRVPFAELHADPVIQVGPVPIVVNLDLVCYFQVDADGRVTVDVEQNLKGDFRVGGNFTWAKGWTGVSESEMTGEPLKATVTATGKVKAALGAEATIGLYGTVGVTADLAPYLRAEADARAEGSANGTGSARGSWALYGGVDLTGTLNIQLSIFGTPIFQKKIPLGALQKEWLLTKGEVATA